MNRIKCMIYEKQYKDKPTAEIGKIQNSFKQTEIEIEDLAMALSKGATFKPALLNLKNSNGFISQQIFALDFDENTTIEKEFERCKKLSMSPCFAYTSFSHTEEHHKFRMVFFSERVITDIDERNRIQLTLMKMFPTADKMCKDVNRLFFGGRKLIYNNYEQRIDVDKILDLYGVEYDVVKDIDKKINHKRINNSDNKNYMLNIEAIKSLNVDVMKGVLGTTNKEDFKSSSISCTINPPKIFKNEDELYDYINHNIDLGEFLGIGNNTVRCVFPNHNDKTPSAHIYITDDGTPIYKCFGCDCKYSIITMVKELAICKSSEAIEFVKSVYNLKLEKTEWANKQIELMISSVNYLDSQEFINEFPELSKLIRTRKIHIQKMLMYFTKFVNENLQVDGKPLFFASYDTLMKVCGINKDNKIVMSQTLTLFTLLNMLKKVETDKIPEVELNKAKSISAKYGFKKLTNFYSFSEYDLVQLENSENIAKTLKKNNITLKGISREYILRTFGIDLADKVYPQYKYNNKQGTSKKSNDKTNEIAIKINKAIERDGFCFEKYIKGNNESEKQWKKSIQEILSGYGLKRVRLNKELKEKYGITTIGYPFLIVKE